METDETTKQEETKKEETAITKDATKSLPSATPDVDTKKSAD